MRHLIGSNFLGVESALLKFVSGVSAAVAQPNNKRIQIGRILLIICFEGSFTQTPNINERKELKEYDQSNN